MQRSDPVGLAHTNNVAGGRYHTLSQVVPSPEFSKAELLDQIAALWAELRDGRVLQAKQSNELSAESTRLAKLTQELKQARREQLDLAAKLNNERDEVAAIHNYKRFNVAIKNHAEAQDKCARAMAECEELRTINGTLGRRNQELEASTLADQTAFDRRLKEVQHAFRVKLEETEATFARKLKTSKQKMLVERSRETETLKSELDSRESKIRKLEHDFNRQCEINAIFTINYDRDTSFTKHLHVPLSVQAVVTSGLGLASTLSNQTCVSSPRSPLTNSGNNHKVESRKRPYAATGGNEKEHSPLKLSKSYKYNSPAKCGNPFNEADSSHSKFPLRKLQQLPTPEGSLRIRKQPHN